MKGVTDLIQEESDQADLTPLIDCVFLLLLFFIVTSTFSEQSFFEVELPTAKHAQVSSPNDATVLSISDQGEFAVGSEKVAEEELGAHIEKLNSQSPIKLIVINGHRKAPYEKVAIAIDIAQGLKAGGLSFTVEQ